MTIASNAELVRWAKSQCLCRDVNENVEEMNKGFSDICVSHFVCECSNESCLEPLELTHRQYERLRSVPTHFAIANGHDLPVGEIITEENERYTVVEKTGVAGEAAVRLDPRARISSEQSPRARASRPADRWRAGRASLE